jgi:hypothetical protein
MRGHTTRKERTRRQMLIKAFVWVFIALFTFSVAGGLIAIVAAR